MSKGEMSNSSQYYNAQPLSKKPKLDIGRQINSSSPFRSIGSESLRGDLCEEICSGKVGLHVAVQPRLTSGQDNLSSPVRSTSSQDTVGDMYDELWGDDLDSAALEKVDFDETQALSQMTEVVKNNENRPKAFNSNPPPASSVNSGSNRFTNKFPAVSTKKNSPGVPLRRTASSGWPSASTISFSATKNISNRNVNDINSSQGNLEQLLLENKTLKAQLTKKTGEVSLLRDRLHSVEQDFDKQKKGYSDKIESIKQEAERNSVNFLKEIRSLKGQLEVKTMEMETAERRVQHMSSMNRLNSESPRHRGVQRPVYSPARAGARHGQKEDQLMCRHGQMKAKSFTFSLDLLKQLVTPELLKPSHLETPIGTSTHMPSNPSLFSGHPTASCHPSNSHGNPSSSCQQPTSTKWLTTNTEKLSSSGGFSSRCQLFSGDSRMEPLKTVLEKTSLTCPYSQPCGLSLLIPRLLDINSENAHQIISQVTESCLLVVTETFQLHLSPPTQRHLERHKSLPQPKALDLTQPVDLLYHKELYSNERGICARRALALQSLLVQASTFAAELLLPRTKTEELENSSNIIANDLTNKTKSLCNGTSPYPSSHQMLIVIRDGFHHMKSHRSHNFEGVFAAVMALLRSILQADIKLSQQSQDLIVQILQGVVSSRPGSLVLYYILQVLLEASKYSYVTASLCRNSDTCILQALCTRIQLLETPGKHVLSDIFTSWVLTLFYSNGLNSPKWLFSVPSQTCCQCRPLLSRLCLTMLGEACSKFPTAEQAEKPLIEKLLNRGVLLVSTLLYHDEHFGVNVDPASEGHYELFIWSMNTLSETTEIKLNDASREILESLTIQEGRREPVYTAVGSENSLEKCDTLLRSLLLFDDIQHKDVLHFLDT